MEGMPLSVCRAMPTEVAPDWFPVFKRVSSEFVKSLDDSISELAILNLPQSDFMDLLMGRRLPDNLTIKFRRPIFYGGKIEANNMFLMPLFNAGLDIDIFMAEQLGQTEVFYPDPAKKVYVPTRLLSGGTGGNATEDRLAQGFAAMNLGRE